MPDTRFDYSNLSGRRPGPVLSAASLVLRGVRDVQAQVEPYARAWERHNHAAVQADGPLWVVLGDSMAQGIGASAFDRGWSGQLAERLPDHRMVNLSVSGGRLSDLLERQIPTMESLGQPDLVTVIVGSNDLVSPDCAQRSRTGWQKCCAGCRPGASSAPSRVVARVPWSSTACSTKPPPIATSTWRSSATRGCATGPASSRPTTSTRTTTAYRGMADIVAEALARR